ncbi:MAG: hypothetical protein AAGK21_11660 [Bacteroidota bacterium]
MPSELFLTLAAAPYVLTPLMRLTASGGRRADQIRPHRRLVWGVVAITTALSLSPLSWRGFWTDLVALAVAAFAMLWVVPRPSSAFGAAALSICGAVIGAGLVFVATFQAPSRTLSGPCRAEVRLAEGLFSGWEPASFTTHVTLTRALGPLEWVRVRSETTDLDARGTRFADEPGCTIRLVDEGNREWLPG